MRTWHPRERFRQCVLAWGLVALVLMSVPPAVGQPALVDRLRGLNLSAYPPGLWLPLFTGQTVTGKAMSVAALREWVVLVHFWATWCAECHPEMVVFERLHQEFAAQGLTVLGVNVREEPQRLQRYAREAGLTYPLVMDPEGEIAQAYGVIGLPTTFLVGRDGRPVALARATGMGKRRGAGARPGAPGGVRGAQRRSMNHVALTGRLVCDAVGIDLIWYKGAATGQNALPWTTPP